jgi:hypothetical protein
LSRTFRASSWMPATSDREDRGTTRTWKTIPWSDSVTGMPFTFRLPGFFSWTSARTGGPSR